MQVAMICEKCAKVHTEGTDGANLIIDFRQKQLAFICQSKDCKHDNIFDFSDWKKRSGESPLPPTRIV